VLVGDHSGEMEKNKKSHVKKGNEEALSQNIGGDHSTALQPF